MAGHQQNKWFASLPLIVVTLALIIIALNALVGAQSGRAPLREALFDYYQRLKPAPATASSKIHVVTIDQESVEKIGPWPWPRTYMAQIVEALARSGARGVIIAEPVDVPDPLSPETIGEFWLNGTQDQALADQLALLPRTNEVLARALANVPAGIGVAQETFPLTTGIERQRGDMQETGDWVALRDDDVRYLALPSARRRYAVDPALSAAATPVVLGLPTDPDGVLRRAFLVWADRETPRPALALQAARLTLGGTKLEIVPEKVAVTDRGHTPAQIVLGDNTLALESGGTLRLYPQRRSRVGSTAAWKILEGSASATAISGAVVLIGQGTDIGPGVRTARGPLAPVMAHAILADQLTNGVTLKRPLWIGYLEAVAVMLLGAGAIMAAQRVQFWRAVGFAAGAALLLFVLSATAFMAGGLLINPILPALAMFVGIFSIAGGKSVGTVLLDDHVRSNFKGMLPEPAMRALRQDKDRKLLDGDNRKISVLACELRITDEDLNALAENPDDVTRIMAAASHNLRNTIISIGGTVDQAEGGRLFAYLNAPLETADHVEKACAAALAMIESMDRTNAELSAAKRTRHIQVHLAIGVATGRCHVGPMGHGRSNRYSAIGPAVDRAAFLRRQSEFYGPAIICDDAVYRESHHKYAFLELDRLNTPHAERPINIHALIGNPFIKSSKNFRELEAAHRAMIQAYRAGDSETAERELATIRQFPAAKIALFDVYADRIAALKDGARTANWDGAHEPAL
ncbi:MAG: adenylate/guanylate cyclase domain-containing protein [Pseudomonadota bacterium]